MRTSKKFIGLPALLLLAITLSGCGQYDVLDQVAELSTDAVQTETAGVEETETETALSEPERTEAVLSETAETDSGTEIPETLSEPETKAETETESETGRFASNE